MSIKLKIKEWFLTHPSLWISTRDLRQDFGEAADRRVRELKREGFEIIKKRGIKADGSIGNTFYWKLGTN